MITIRSAGWVNMETRQVSEMGGVIELRKRILQSLINETIRNSCNMSLLGYLSSHQYGFMHYEGHLYLNFGSSRLFRFLRYPNYGRGGNNNYSKNAAKNGAKNAAKKVKELHNNNHYEQQAGHFTGNFTGNGNDYGNDYGNANAGYRENQNHGMQQNQYQNQGQQDQMNQMQQNQMQGATLLQSGAGGSGGEVQVI
jgi:hypothetical protein